MDKYVVIVLKKISILFKNILWCQILIEGIYKFKKIKYIITKRIFRCIGKKINIDIYTSLDQKIQRRVINFLIKEINLITIIVVVQSDDKIKSLENTSPEDTRDE